MSPSSEGRPSDQGIARKVAFTPQQLARAAPQHQKMAALGETPKELKAGGVIDYGKYTPNTKALVLHQQRNCDKLERRIREVKQAELDMAASEMESDTQ